MTSVRAFEEMRQRVEIVTCLRIALRLRRELLGTNRRVTRNNVG